MNISDTLRDITILEELSFKRANQSRLAKGIEHKSLYYNHRVDFNSNSVEVHFRHPHYESRYDHLTSIDLSAHQLSVIDEVWDRYISNIRRVKDKKDLVNQDRKDKLNLAHKREQYDALGKELRLKK